MKHLSKIEAFYNSLDDISLINRDLDAKREELKGYIYSYNNKIQNSKANIVIKNRDLNKLFNNTIEMIKSSSNNWVDNFNKLLEKEKFRSDLENYFIVIIFGKVKAGKSSLGNFIAQNRLKDKEVNFFEYDEAGKEHRIKELKEIDSEMFKVDNLECTMKIQGFKLDSMAWIDTPGLGSMTKENEELAKEYMQSADYIIYPTSSDSPLQNDEIDQLKELFEQNKKVTICITKSDEKERRKDSNGKFIRENGKIKSFLVNKPLENRKSQEDYVKTEIAKINKGESLLGDIISISVHTAKLALENQDEELLRGSNIPKFYELLTEVVQKKASKLKAETPYSALKSFIDNNVLGVTNKPLTISNIKDEIDTFDKSIDETLNKLDISIGNIRNEVRKEVEFIISKYYKDIDKRNYKEMFKKIDREIKDSISKLVEDNLKDIFDNFDNSFKSFTNSISGDEFKIDDEYIEYSYSTKSRNSGIGGLFGAIAGFFVGGPVGAIAGSAIGSAVGYATGSTHTSKINVGDNRDEAIREFKEREVELNYEAIKRLYSDYKDSFFMPLKSVVKDMRGELESFEAKIENFKKGLV